jgi:hypothetical protein
MTPAAKVRKLFLAELRARGVPLKEALDDGRFVVSVGDADCTISLDNLVRTFTRDEDPGAVARFVDNLLNFQPEMPPWEEARARVLFSAEPNDHDFGDTVREQVSGHISRVAVYLYPDGQRIAWLTPGQLEEWKITQEELYRAADANLAALLRETPVEVEEIEDCCLGMLATDSPFKASLIFCSNLREAVEPALGWPVYAVIPCRDFAYLIPEGDRDELLPRVAGVILREYSEGAYPISREVYHITDEGVEAVGYFASPEEAEQ